MYTQRNLIRCLSMGLLLAVGLATRIQAQRGGGYGGRHRSGSGSEEPRQRDDPADELSKRFEDMATTKPVVKDLKLSDPAKDSIDRIEKTYKNRFRTYVVAVKRQFEEAKGQGSAPDLEVMQKLQSDARTLQDQEYSEIRALVPADQQAKFDANVKQHREDDDKAASNRRPPMRQPGSPQPRAGMPNV